MLKPDPLEGKRRSQTNGGRLSEGGEPADEDDGFLGENKELKKMAFSMNSLVHGPKNDEQVMEFITANKILNFLSEGDEADFEPKYLDSIDGAISLYGGKLFSKVRPIREDQLSKEWLFKEELLEQMLDPLKYNHSIFTLVVDTYMWYMTEKELFGHLLAKYCCVPEGLAASEQQVFEEQVLGKVRLKVILFMGEWYKKYRDLVLTGDFYQTCFYEVLKSMYIATKDKKWIKDKIKLLLGIKDVSTFKEEVIGRIKDLWTRNDKVKQNILRLNNTQLEQNDSKLEKYEVFFSMLKNESRKLAEQICLFDFENFRLVSPNELLATNWRQDKKHEYAPNVVYISECFNRLSRLLTLHIIYSKDNKQLVRRTDDIVQLSDNLRYLNNFNSAYAVHLAISNVWLKNYMESAGVAISSRAREAFEKQKATFSVNNGQYRLQQEQFRATYPTIPFLGLYVQQILVICERKDTYDQMGRINLDKFTDLEKTLQKIITTKNYPYDTYKQNLNIQALLRNLPPTKKTEELIQKRFNELIKKYEK